ncbi:hypothetical protein HSBAA_36260 [Vreelandella sulfidaeris]|uniref:Uncharacterized protein n=1 Tax=Vreelandella sulfidaeris TaxID=115553 RepID=A0A455U837_9GAMM|nr:hypothetical protein HSBAA_36260 [Halomonas sulfidaeris]
MHGFGNYVSGCAGVYERGGYVEEYILWFDQLGMSDVERVGGKMPRWVK